MIRSEFMREMEDLLQYWGQDYCKSCEWEYVPDPGGEDCLAAELRIETNFRGHRFAIPLVEKDGHVVIAFGEDNFLDLDAEGLFTWLWFETLERLDRYRDEENFRIRQEAGVARD